jgi:menaquinone-dependent protoporphyrinogen oxidase
MTETKNRILVTAASKYRATLEIAQAIGEALAERGFDVTVSPIEDVTAVDGYDAVVAGSAVYAGHWMKPAREFVERVAADLADRPVWLFSSGPIGDPPRPQEDPVDASEFVEQSGAREHRVFGGKLDKSRLSFGEKAIVMALRAPEGDFRDWDEVRSWATGIADSLSGEAES